MVVVLDALNQVSESSTVLHSGNFLALYSICINSTGAHYLLLAWFADLLRILNSGIIISALFVVK
jgi:hypothetical protein